MAINTDQTENQKKAKANPLAKQENVRAGVHADDISHFAVTIGKPQDEVFAFFRDLKNLPLFMKDLKEIKVISEKKSHWVVEIDAGLKAEWDAEITNERPNEMIAWRSVEGSEVQTSGAVWFRPASAGMGTIVSLFLDYKIPGGKLTELITKFTGEDPDSLAFINLRRLKCYLETGEIATTTGQSSGRDEDLEPTEQQKH